MLLGSQLSKSSQASNSKAGVLDWNGMIALRLEKRVDRVGAATVVSVIKEYSKAVKKVDATHESHLEGCSHNFSSLHFCRENEGC